MEHKFETWCQMCLDHPSTSFVNHKKTTLYPRVAPRSAVYLKKRKLQVLEQVPVVPVVQEVTSPAPKPPPRLPQDCWSRVFSFLPAPDHLSFHYVCRSFHKAVSLASSWPSSLDGLKLCDRDFTFFQPMPFTSISIGSSSSFGAESLASFLSDPRRDKLQVSPFLLLSVGKKNEEKDEKLSAEC